MRGSLRLLSPLALLAAAGAIGACQDQVTTLIPLQGDCPAEAPIGGSPCGTPAVCGYQGGDCGVSFQCQDGLWQETSSDCPAPPPPGSCPASIPGTGAPCGSPGQSCTFDVPGACPGVFVATCSASGWTVDDQSPPCAPPSCPTTEPVAGTPCDYPYDCNYSVVPPGCPPHTEHAACTGGVWVIDVPAACGT